MADLTAKRTLVKSPPELWSELSEVERLAKHLAAFGEITITRVEPERTVAWEGETASGTVSIEPSGWGTKVTLTAQVEAPAAEEPAAEEPPAEEPPAEEPPAEEPAAQEPPPAPAAEAPEPEPELTAAEEPPAAEASDPEPARQGFFTRLFRRRTTGVGTAVEEPIVEAPVVDGAPDDERVEPAGTAAAEPPAEEPAAEEPAAAEPAAAEEPTASADSLDPQGVLEGALEALGSAHHRPFSRA